MEETVTEKGTRKDRSERRSSGFQLLKAIEGNRIISLGSQVPRA